MKYLIVGLGNIGAEYAGTRHNIGFNVLDALAEASNAVFTTARYGDVAQVKHKGRTLILLKPSTYMNLSGKAVRYWMEAEKIAPENLLVVSDDIALPFGTLRLRPKGSAGGHNGLKNIAELLGTENFARMRFGVGATSRRGIRSITCWASGVKRTGRRCPNGSRSSATRFCRSPRSAWSGR